MISDLGSEEGIRIKLMKGIEEHSRTFYSGEAHMQTAVMRGNTASLRRRKDHVFT